MAATHVALLRGINVGTAKRVAMADLRKLLEGLGYSGVKTLLNSGNAVFTTKAAPDVVGARIEKAMTKDLGVSARVIVLTAAEVAAIVAKNPLLKIADNPSRLMIAVLADAKAADAIKPLLKRDWTPEVMKLGPRAAYFWMPEGIVESKCFKEVSKALKDGVTTRNWATMQKLHALMTEGLA